ncbi:hypothetical protein VOLCADRAFT_98602 [Volvox carteri f. nagariensis]|uniref:Secreted protein n=1 Tax=Volvox carteri f. nagariensis TaxID=3068 RepID=D8UFS6_VOLCA|nr:uncharacterized protein VOLCADRAFT_98602 [Volvox carteri f. nagariensis]EFJ41388.1 hypothetical protein VOLCADRAFT_98602 [Volvox carteri f. nagariensis]|eukprot:XP_002957494.1 hypothetical protein VOLCADRAFT_98602 [Volvox carteri f. nagariensis]
MYGIRPGCGVRMFSIFLFFLLFPAKSLSEEGRRTMPPLPSIRDLSVPPAASFPLTYIQNEPPDRVAWGCGGGRPPVLGDLSIACLVSNELVWPFLDIYPDQ